MLLGIFTMIRPTQVDHASPEFQEPFPVKCRHIKKLPVPVDECVDTFPLAVDLVHIALHNNTKQNAVRREEHQGGDSFCPAHGFVQHQKNITTSHLFNSVYPAKQFQIAADTTRTDSRSSCQNAPISWKKLCVSTRHISSSHAVYVCDQIHRQSSPFLAV